MSRQRPSLRRPSPAEDLRRFPRFRVTRNHALWRLVREGQGPWWFGSSMAGRFDLPTPFGTCYLASDDLGAMLETLGPDLLPGGLAPTRLLRNRLLHRLSVPHDHAVANCLVQRASQWVTAEMSTLVPYEIPQAWASALHGDGFAGIRYTARHSTSRRTYAVALFGPAGERVDWPSGTKTPLTARQERRLRTRCGITLFETPFEDELTFAADPTTSEAL